MSVRGGAIAAVSLIAAVVVVFSSPRNAHADPAFCGAREDPFVCTARSQTGPPTPGESSFIDAIRGHSPGSDAQLLNAGRTICGELSGGDSGQYVDGEVATYLGTNSANAGQVVDEATEDVCPGVHVSG